MIRLPIPTPAELLAEACRAIAAYRATDPLYDDPRGVELETRWVDALQTFFSNGGTREEADAIEDEAFMPPAIRDAIIRATFDPDVM